MDRPHEIPNTKRSLDEPHDAFSKSEPFLQGPVAPNTQSQYMPLHGFPAKHYKYLPEFDGEYESCTSEKHLQDSDYFCDHFEIEHDDVCMRAFSQSFQGDVKKRFKHLHPRSINTWEEFSHMFLDFWGETRSLE